jgi:nucleoside-diphosphate-sugar epimerase
MAGSEITANRIATPAGDVREMSADIGLAQRVLAYRSRVPLEEGLLAELQWHVENARRHRLPN